MGLYQFCKEDAYRFASEMHLRTKLRGTELQLSDCPYCHGASHKDGYSFSISTETGMFKCLRASCGAHGNMITLHKDFGFSLGNDVDEYLDHTKKYRNIHRKEKPEVRPQAIQYLQNRGISEKICKQYNITTQKEHDNILVFPFYDENAILQFAKYRKTDFDKEKDRNKEWCEKDCKPILFGMDQCNRDNKTLIMTEGQIDSLSVAECGIENAVSVPTGKNGFTWIPHCWDFLQSFDTLIVFGDHERDEITLLEEMSNRFKGTTKHVRPEDYKDCKDANELLVRYGKQAVIDAVNNAVPVKVKAIKDITEIKRVDISKMEKISTGFAKLNKTLGGFYFGQTILLTGERGKGKSTLASQFGTLAVQQGYNVFFYSGELMDWYFRMWIDLQIAGRLHLNGIQNSYGTIDYSVDGNAYELMNKFLNGRIKIYDNNIIDEEDHASLLETMQDAINQYNCRVLFVDNLLTALEDDVSSDLNRQQTKFCKDLSKLAKNNNVIIFLIAHPRKTNEKYFRNDEISGSGNITNLMDVVLRYDEPSDKEITAPRVIQVFKNRLTGKLNKYGIPVYYQESSKRISADENFDWMIGWEKEDFIGPDDYDQMQIPF